MLQLGLVVATVATVATVASPSAFAVAPAPPATASVTEQPLSPQSLDAAFQPRRLALVVGVGDYADPRFRPLRFAAKDARDVAEFLRTHNAGPHDETIVLTGRDATVAHVTAALDELERKNTSASDLVVVYLSTHGSLAYQDARRLERFAALTDSGAETIASTGIPLGYLEGRLARLRSEKKALILALCHAGAGKSELPTELRRELETMKAAFFPPPLVDASSATMVLSASAFGQPAHEDDHLRNDIYTHFLLEGLVVNDANGDGAVSLFEAHEYARARTYDHTRGAQTPTALMSLEGMDPLILNGRIKHRSAPLIFADAERFRGVNVFVDGEKKGTLWNPQNVPSGTVRLTLVDPQHPETPLVDHRVFLEKDTAYAVSTLFHRRPTVGFEATYALLPLPPGLDGLTRSYAPGIAVRASDLWATPLAARFSYATMQREGEVELEGGRAASTLTAQLVSATLGRGFTLGGELAATAQAGVERLALTRAVLDPSIDRGAQAVSVVYPALYADVRWSHIMLDAYAGLGAAARAPRLARLPERDVDGGATTRALRPLTGTFFIGYGF